MLIIPYIVKSDVNIGGWYTGAPFNKFKSEANMSKIIYNIVSLSILEVMFILTVLLIMTPEKTEQGNYTNFVKYWTNNQYVMDNFKSTTDNTTKSRMM